MCFVGFFLIADKTKTIMRFSGKMCLFFCFVNKRQTDRRRQTLVGEGPPSLTNPNVSFSSCAFVQAEMTLSDLLVRREMATRVHGVATWTPWVGVLKTQAETTHRGLIIIIIII